MISLPLSLLRDNFTANAASPPVETEPATMSPRVDKQNGHIVYLQVARLAAKPPLYIGDGSESKIRSHPLICPTNNDGRIKRWRGLIAKCEPELGFVMFDTGLLRSFVAVAESGGFTNAAKLLNSTQSTVSAQIQRLEDEAGQLLFVRSTRSVQLTSAGETLLGYARTILRLNEDARLRLSGARHAGRVRVGANEDLTDSWLPKVLHRFGSQYPEVEVELEIGIGPSLFEMVKTKELDLAVGGLCDGREGRRLWSEPLVWAFSAGIEVPSVLPLAFFPEPCPYREAALRALAGSPKRWRIVSTSSSLAGVRAAAMAGLALTPLPLQTVRPSLRILGKKEKMPRLPEIEYVLQTRENDTRPAVSALANLIQEMAAKAISTKHPALA
jgi:DNA-binding transcriptional LysR family regulator